MVSAKIFPVRLRSTYHGISYATRKAWAKVGAFGFLYLAQSTNPYKTDKGYPQRIGGVRNSLMILCAICGLGFFFSFLVLEANGKSLEEMSRGNKDDFDEHQIAGTNNITF